MFRRRLRLLLTNVVANVANRLGLLTDIRILSLTRLCSTTLGYPNFNSHFAVVTSDALLTILAFTERYSSPLHHVTIYRHRQYRG